MNVVFVTLFCLLPFIFAHPFDADDSVCPPENAISPCTCNPESRHVRCDALVSTTDLRNAFKNLAGGSYEELMIHSSTLQYIPHEIQQVRFQRLYIRESTFVDLFDAPPTTLTSLEVIHIEKSKLLRKKWSHFTPLTSLRELRILDTSVRVLDEDLGKSLPKSLKSLTFRGTETRTIKPGAFHGLDNIEALEVKDAELINLRRDIFPTPFNVERLSFIENKLITLPKDLFTQMPKLKVVDLRVNGLIEVPEEAFGETASQLDILLLDVNPLKCDCTLEWLVKNGPEVRSGICESPVEMKGKRLSTLTTDDFEC
ncbi:slit homolog 1 protein-like [Uloborus diversus]|uniref:slit homolog 1 protein-like n=1 Tax=Uloborus diversus TaxID=327109 RepID=UPI002409CDAF|nr:slit homolog 1 protein-like [Uloborus diversus]